MRRTRIDFAPRSLRRLLFQTPPRMLGPLAGAVAACALAGVYAWDYAEQRRELDALHAALAARASAAAPAPAAAQRKIAVPEQQANAVNDAVLQLNLPWRELYDAVRAATPASVALLALEPDAKRRTLRLTAEAKNSDDMFAYIGKLQEQAWFTSVVLTRHEVAEQDPNRPLRFQLSAQWGGR
ncbi:PilN domain-containing protein [Massilia sp. DD77]|uniref:PilN domain-containing protein n=1 Tax=Massilia sp. DD77 TaxID=3109349 RepID=UPI002FFFDE76